MINTPETLSPAQIAELEQVLVAERSRLERFVPRTVVAGDGYAAGAADAPLADGPFAPTPTQADARLDAVLDALRRIHEGKYGACNRCGEPIPFGRLIVLPESDHCIRCGAA